jgi:hypothetical protein
MGGRNGWIFDQPTPCRVDVTRKTGPELQSNRKLTRPEGKKSLAAA